MKKKKNQNQSPKFFERDGTLRHHLHPDEPIRTRRDFLRTGLIASATSVAIPSVASMLFAARSARSDGGSCSTGAGDPNMPAYIHIDCAGGDAVHSAIAGVAADGASLPAGSSLLGYGSDPQDYHLITTYGLPIPVSRQAYDPTDIVTSNNTYPFGDRMMKWPQEMKDLFACVGQACAGSSDSQINQNISATLINRAGRGGTLMATTSLGSSNAQSGGNGSSATGGGLTSPTTTFNFSDQRQLTRVFNFGDALTDLKQSALDRAARTMINMGDSQKSLFANLPVADALSHLFGCGFLANLMFAAPAGSGANLDCRTDADIQRLWGITTATAENDPKVVEASAVYHAIMDNVPSAVLTLGGADYHDGNNTRHRSFQDRKAMLVDNILQFAYAKGKAVMLTYSTDGGISMGNAGNQTDAGLGDNNLTSGMKILFLAKVGTKRATINYTQAGVLQDTGVADPRHYFGDFKGAAQHVVLATYLALAGKVNYSDYTKIFAGVGSDILIASNQFKYAQLLG